MTNLIFNIGLKKLIKGEIDLINDSIKVAVMASGYSPDIDVDLFYSDLSEEVSGTGYSVGGKLLTNKDVNKDTGNDRAVFTADDLIWSFITISDAAGCVLYKDTGDPDTSPLIAFVDFCESFSKVEDDLIIAWSSDGIFYVGGE